QDVPGPVMAAEQTPALQWALSTHFWPAEQSPPIGTGGGAAMQVPGQHSALQESVRSHCKLVHWRSKKQAPPVATLPVNMCSHASVTLSFVELHGASPIAFRQVSAAVPS